MLVGGNLCFGLRFFSSNVALALQGVYKSAPLNALKMRECKSTLWKEKKRAVIRQNCRAHSSVWLLCKLIQSTKWLSEWLSCLDGKEKFIPPPPVCQCSAKSWFMSWGISGQVKLYLWHEGDMVQIRVWQVHFGRWGLQCASGGNTAMEWCGRTWGSWKQFPQLHPGSDAGVWLCSWEDLPGLNSSIPTLRWPSWTEMGRFSWCCIRETHLTKSVEQDQERIIVGSRTLPQGFMLCEMVWSKIQSLDVAMQHQENAFTEMEHVWIKTTKTGV